MEIVLSNRHKIEQFEKEIAIANRRITENTIARDRNVSDYKEWPLLRKQVDRLHKSLDERYDRAQSERLRSRLYNMIRHMRSYQEALKEDQARAERDLNDLDDGLNANERRKAELMRNLAQIRAQLKDDVIIDSVALGEKLSQHENLTHVRVYQDEHDAIVQVTFVDLLLMPTNCGTPLSEFPEMVEQYKSFWDGNPIPLGKITIRLRRSLTESDQFRLEQRGAEYLYSGYSEEKCHPHWISHNSPCLGDFGPSITEAMAAGDFETAVYCLMEFLRQADNDDCAGMWWPLWTGNIDRDEFVSRFMACEDCDRNPCRCDDWCNTCERYECVCEYCESCDENVRYCECTHEDEDEDDHDHDHDHQPMEQEGG